ncbi:ATP-dependent protease ATPase subunit HslU [Gossypium arboreum]|uniref:ATP-dependent protease ATPase subunit HslU n=1 Tax=Gossypium arboreum TaxID=29729 RepID=A0A0B0P5Y5_GOSAR|nr:ATP-dependent protease ATPase subunit HslU [Gossypium arboreum]
MCIVDNMPRRRLQDPSIIQNPPNSEETNSDQQTAIRSSNVPNIVHKPIEIQTENCGRRKIRRRMLLKDLYNLNSVERVKVSRNSHGKPIGSEAQLLAGYLGIIARNERFVLEVSDNYVKKAVVKKCRDHKSTLKKEYFKKNISLEEKLRNVSLGMLGYQWEDADRERVGTTIRKKQKFMHTTGSKSFACVVDDEEKLKDKRAEYEAMASSDSSVNLDDIDNLIQLAAIHAFGVCRKSASKDHVL